MQLKVVVALTGLGLAGMGTTWAQASVAVAGSGCALVYGVCAGPFYNGPGCCYPGSECVAEAAAVGSSYGESAAPGYGALAPGPSTDTARGADVYSRCRPFADTVLADPAAIDVLSITLEDTLGGLEEGTFASETLVEAFLAQIARFEETYNAFTFRNPFALSQARTSDRRRAAGRTGGAMEGVPIVVKESLDVYGFPSTFGWNETSFKAGGVDLFPLRNAELVELLLDAGAINMGKCNMPPFSLSPADANASWAGPTLNGANIRLRPGGSSTGSATAVAAGFAVWAVAAETGGSIQFPASAQGLVGLKPTFGIVPTTGLAPLSRSLDVLGPITRTVRDAAIAFDVMSGHGTPAFAGRAPGGGYASLLGEETLQGKRIGLFGPSWRGPGSSLSPAVAALYEAAVAELAALGAEIVRDPFEPDTFADAGDVYGAAFAAAGFDLSSYLARSFNISSFAEFADIVGTNPLAPGGVLGIAAEVLPTGPDGEPDPSAPPDGSIFRAAQMRYSAAFNDTLDALRLDALVYPTSPQLQVPITSEAPVDVTTVPVVNIIGVPVVTVPSTRLERDLALPFTLAFFGRKYDEAKLLALAYDYEQATQLRIVPALPTLQ